MAEAAAFVCNLTALSILAAVVEFLVPAGKLKHTVTFAVGIVFTSAVMEQILGIITRMGV